MPDTALNDDNDDVAVPRATINPQFHKQGEKYAGPPPPQTDLSTYHSYHDREWGPTRVRLHSFLTGREAEGMKPIAGLTASILLEVAQIGYGATPEGFEADAPGQAGRRERIAWQINRSTRFIDAIKREGIRWDWEKEERKEQQKRLKLEADANDDDHRNHKDGKNQTRRAKTEVNMLKSRL